MWQEIIAYVIIAATVGWAIWRIFFRKGLGCSCSSGGASDCKGASDCRGASPKASAGCDGCPYCSSCKSAR